MNPESVSESDLVECFERLRTAEVFEGFPVGGMGQRHSNYEAFVLARRAGPRARAHVEESLRDATPAGRLYAALLLRDFDEAAGRRALEQLSADDAPVEAVWDCSPDQSTLGQLAAEALSGRTMVDIRTDGGVR